MKVSIIAPVDLLSEYCVTDIQYCLPTLIVNSERYRDFYMGRRNKGDTTILDCKKIGWKRAPENLSIIKESIDIINPHIVILPSYMFEVKRTIDVVYRFFEEIGRSREHRYYGCVEGASYKDAHTCTKAYSTIPVTEFAIPSHMYNITKDIDGKKRIIYIDNHLNIEELDGRDGILATSLPIRLGIQGRLLSDHSPSPPSLTFEEEDKYPPITKKNVEETIEFYR